MRKKARLFLEMALLPPGYLLTPHSLANAMEEGLYESFKEEDLSSGKLYLRRLKAMMDLLQPGGKNYQPVMREIIAAGGLPLYPESAECEDVVASCSAYCRKGKPTRFALPQKLTFCLQKLLAGSLRYPKLLCSYFEASCCLKSLCSDVT